MQRYKSLFSTLEDFKKKQHADDEEYVRGFDAPLYDPKKPGGNKKKKTSKIDENTVGKSEYLDENGYELGETNMYDDDEDGLDMRIADDEEQHIHIDEANLHDIVESELVTKEPYDDDLDSDLDDEDEEDEEDQPESTLLEIDKKEHGNSHLNNVNNVHNLKY